MKVEVISEVRLIQDKSGNYYCKDGTVAYQFWTRYLSAFDEVIVLARVFKVNEIIECNERKVNGPNVTVIPLPKYIGPFQYLLNYFKIVKQLKSRTSSDYTVICRVPGALGGLYAKLLLKSKKKFSLEVVGDPYDVFARKAVKHPFRALFRIIFTKSLKKIVKNAQAVSYVTEQALQKRYPASKGVFTTNYSSIELTVESYISEPFAKKIYKKELNLISVGSLDQMYKAPDILIKTVKILNNKDIPATLTWLGDGKYRTEMKRLAEELEISERINWVGRVSAGKEVCNYLDNADIFIMASRTEGLPRALIEAMARALPCIGTNVGGIPELLEKDCIIKPDSVDELVRKIMQFNSDDACIRLDKRKRNLKKSKAYSNTILSAKRKSFFIEAQK